MSGNPIKELRELTGSGFIDCKKALDATNGNIQEAIKWLQENGIAKAVKKSGRIAAEGLVSTLVNDKCGVIYEINSETDFVAKNDKFISLVEEVGEILISNHFSNNEEAIKLKNKSGKTIEELTTLATSTIGEKISFRRALKFHKTDGVSIGSYTHSDGQKASLFIAKGSKDSDLKGVAMHITAMNPEYLNESSVPAEKVQKLKEEFLDSPSLKGKPDAIKENILKGMLRKALSEDTLTEQEYVVESGKTIAKFLLEKQATEISMVRFEVGEGIVKEVVDFAVEVKAQMSK
ncbi:MAG: elongation factor Ts [Mycoplasmataceae bacterium]|nr:elongation factor Ts [Mycoplasmataceae bacterium]